MRGKLLAQPGRQETSQPPGPFRQAPLAGFLPGEAQRSDVSWLSFGAPAPRAYFHPAPKLGVLFCLMPTFTETISYSKCLPVFLLKAHTQGPSSIPGTRSEERIRVKTVRLSKQALSRAATLLEGSRRSTGPEVGVGMSERRTGVTRPLGGRSQQPGRF